ncbi:DUF4031 domain-containing protein [Chelatococcus sp.]|uniref:DUF4031 domain-containing protein n=1 Tax=Chelatococcus sp. TaxID=1953771 RepID=UPI001EB7818A|nr:DUF4031 domain-containing protein [Chelatococcus sp.]MBX3494487.1 DUF4031 domain-containing protein [Parvibaculum sp.]MBX3543612.1 DUF4031 domain-containing protein [Chelatococcus sp.]
MAVYVDDVRHPFGRMVMCHMWADTDEEMHAMADAIGVARRWHQHPPKASWSHYDISLGMKAKAITRGAILTDRYGPVEHVARLQLKSSDSCVVKRGMQTLERLKVARSVEAS